MIDATLTATYGSVREVGLLHDGAEPRSTGFDRPPWFSRLRSGARAAYRAARAKFAAVADLSEVLSGPQHYVADRGVVPVSPRSAVARVRRHEPPALGEVSSTRPTYEQGDSRARQVAPQRLLADRARVLIDEECSSERRPEGLGAIGRVAQGGARMHRLRYRSCRFPSGGKREHACDWILAPSLRLARSWCAHDGRSCP